MKMFALAGILGVAALVMTACTEEEQRPRAADNGSEVPPGGITGPSGGGSSNEGGVTNDAALPDAGGPCNDVVNDGALIDGLAITGDPPLSSGGSLVDGTYDLVAVSVYVGLSGVPGPTGLAYRSTIVVDQGTIRSVREITEGSAVVEERASYTYTTNTNTLVLQTTCPTPGQVLQEGFTFRGTDLLRTNLATKEVFAYTLR